VAGLLLAGIARARRAGESKGGHHVNDWSTIEAIAATEGVDLWVLFPLGEAGNRWLAVTEDAPADRSVDTEPMAGANIDQNSVASSSSPRRAQSRCSLKITPGPDVSVREKPRG
jgi:hypothetical protein